MSTIESESHKSLSTKSPDNLVEAGTQVEQPRPGEASAQPEQAELKIRVIKLKSVLLGNDGIYIQYTWVEGGNPNPNVSYTLPLGMVQEMVQRGVCIFSEGFDDSQGSNVEENLVKLREFVKDQEKLRREREREKGLDLLAETASELSFPVSKNPTEVAGVPGVSTGDQSSEAFTSPETDTVAAQAPEQEPDSGRIEAQQTDSSEQEPDSDGIEARINDILKNENCYARLKLMQDFLISNEFQRSSVSPAYIQLIANAILTIVDQGIQSQGLQFVNCFLMEAHACLGILDKAIDNTESIQTPEQLKEEVEKLNKAIGMESIQIAEQLKERLTELFIRIKDEVAKFGDLVSSIQNTDSIYNTLSNIIEPNSLSFLKLIYQKITAARSQVDGIIKEVFAEPFDQWVQANIDRINGIESSILQEVNEGEIDQDLEKFEKLRQRYNESSSGLSEGKWSEYYSIKGKYIVLKEDVLIKQSRLNEDQQYLSGNDLRIDAVLTELNNKLERARSLISKLDKIIDFQIP